MKNLTIHQVYRRNQVEFTKDIEINESLKCIIHCTINPSNSDIYLLFSEHLYVIPYESGDVTVFKNIKNSSDVITMEYCVTLQELYCAYKTGYVAKIDIIDRTNYEYTIIAKFNNGLQCMKFSPDHELIAAVTDTGIVTTMVLDFHTMSETDLHPEDFGQNEFVNVGWGKKETQFHGSKGKTMALAEPEQLISNENDDGCTQIAWREDGALFAVNFLHEETKLRKFKVFDREGVLCFTSERMNGLENHIAWNPLGDLIAIPQILNDKYVVALFEKNGLKFTELSLPFKPGEVQVRDLHWLPEILIVICYESKTSTTLMQLWTESNSHWYLKQTLVFPVINPLLHVICNNMMEQINKKELIYLTTRDLTFCSFTWCLNHSRGKTMDDKVVCGVIDKNKVLITAFKDGIVPPPMAHQTLETSELQNAIIFGPNKSSSVTNEFCTISCNNKLTFFTQVKESPTLTYQIAKSYGIDFDILHDVEYKALEVKEIHCYPMHHFLWFTEGIILFSVVTENHNLLCVLSLDEMYSKDQLKVQKVYKLNYPIEHIVSSPDADAAYIKIRNDIFKYTQDGKLEKTDKMLNKPCVQMEVIKVDTRDVILALSLDNNFMIDGKEFAKNITSFCVHSDFLLLTTLQSTLICVSLTEVGIQQLSKHDLTVKPWLHNKNETLFSNIYIRRIEKDSRIIAAVPYESKVILQMPRGNLECIQPRALSLYILKYYLNNCDYLLALDMMTKQRINLNLIYDHNPQLFLDNAKKFVEDIVQHNKLNWLNLFLSELQDEDVCSTMYSYCYADCKSDTKANKITVNKIDEICTLLRDVMEEHQDADNLIQSILISLVKSQQKQGLESALSKIKKIKKLEDIQRSTQHFTTVSACQALNCLLHFVNIDMLYDAALGMYDLELAMFIASKSSKDPKEYIPFLNNFKKLNENDMKYSIDVHLKRYELALEHLSKDPTKFEECLDLTRSQKLYRMAIKLFEKNTTEHKKMAEIYGEFLSNENRYLEAGMMFYRSGDFGRSLKSFSMSSDNWEDVIAISKQMKLGKANSYELYKILVERLKADKKYEMAAVILHEYLNDTEEAIALLCEGRFWKYAIRLTTDIERLDLYETHIKPGVKEHAEHVISQLCKIKEDFLKYKSRLAIVRTEIKAKQTLSSEKIYDDKPESNVEVTDFVSDTTSIADTSISSQMSRMSISSSKSYRSSKNRRKQERKLFSLKEGSMFEDLSLIHALYQIVHNAYHDADEWYQLVQVLIRFEFDESAEKILVETKNFFQLIEISKSEIWDKSAPTSLTDIEKDGHCTQTQSQEMIAPIKLIERYITFPPVGEIPRVLNINL